VNKRLRRKLGNKPYRKIFVISTEGSNTEPRYFLWFDNDHIHIKIAKGNCKRAKKNCPSAVLQRMEDHLREEKSKKEKSDQYWLVIDKDQWSDSQIKPLHDWALGVESRGFALSNPNFEYWLLLHFEDAKGINSPRKILERLQRYLPEYEKNLDDLMLKQFEDRFSVAIENARQKDVPACEDWPRVYGTTVYRLIEEILNINKKNDFLSRREKKKS